MAGKAGIKIHGQKELERAFKQVRKETLKEMRPTLRLAALPVRDEAQSLFDGYDSASAEGYRVRVRMRGVAVEQSLRRTTGTRPDFGSLQMRKALIPALEDKQEGVLKAVELMVDMNGRKAGF